MKQILNTTKQTTLEDITNNSQVGIKFVNNCKSIIIEKNRDEFVGLSLALSDSLSLIGSWSMPSKKEYIEKAFKQDGTKAYLFNTNKELIGWLLTK